MSKEVVDPMIAKKLEYHQALFKLHGDIESIKKDESNPFYKSKYVPLPTMLRTLKPVFQKNGFILNQPADIINTQQGPRNAIASILVHVPTGLSENSKLMIDDEKDPQKLGAKITYFRRFTLSALLGLEEVDDDGNFAAGKKGSKSAVSSKDKF